MYVGLASHWTEAESIVLGAKKTDTLLSRADAWPHSPEFSQEMMFLDSATYLPDDILTKVDRATMAVSLEGRVPLLDHRVVEFAWSLPVSLKIRSGRGKWILRRLLAKYLPPQLTERAKAGFGFPLERWLRGPLRDWAESLLEPNRLRSDGLLNEGPIRQMWRDLLAGSNACHYHIWDVLMFQAWCSAQGQPRRELETTVPAAAEARISSFALRTRMEA
jgi:asparagine synthase (glutamine-hydrolysing)